MKISLNAVKEFTKIDIPLEQLVDKIGAQLGAVEDVLDLAKVYNGVTIVRVVSCEKHPNADKLQVCQVYDGGVNKHVKRGNDGLITIVCGAPNVRENMLAVWVPPGVTVPSTADKEPFVLEARDLRGVVSNGMLASAHELGLSDDHNGLLEIESEVKAGDSFAEVFHLDDVIIDIENKMFTHRPDCFGILGVARELAGIIGQQFTSPEWYQLSELANTSESSSMTLTVKNELPELVPRFTVQVFENVKVEPSPLWLQSYLTRIGMRPINNVVDITNYVMAVTGQPMHAFDYDKLKELDGGETATIVVRKPKPDEAIALLNGKTIKPNPDTIMIASASKLIGVGGVMGGSVTEVDNNTQRIVLECANFNMYSIRRSSMSNGLFTDAVTRFNKGQSPLQITPVIKWAAGKLTELTGASAGSVADLGKENIKPMSPVLVEVDFINQRLGETLSKDSITQLLRNVEIEVDMQGEALTITPPFWRTDLSMPEDIVEEVGRLYGFDHLPMVLPTRSLKPANDNSSLLLKKQIRTALSAAGANEALTYSFVHGNLIEKVGQAREQAFQLANAQSPDLQYYRLSVLPSLLERVNANLRAGIEEFAMFEIGKNHNKQDLDENKLPKETDTLALVYAVNSKVKTKAAFYQARAYLEALGVALGINFSYEPYDRQTSSPITEPFELSRSALVSVGDVSLGILGEFKKSVRQALKLPLTSSGFEISLKDLLKAYQPAKPYKRISRFPKIQQDICLKIPVEVTYRQLHERISSSLKNDAVEDSVWTMEPLDIFQKEDDQQHKQITFRITISAYNRTLKNEVVQELLNKVANEAKNKLGAELI